MVELVQLSLGDFSALGHCETDQQSTALSVGRGGKVKLKVAAERIVDSV